MKPEDTSCEKTDVGETVRIFSETKVGVGAFHHSVEQKGKQGFHCYEYHQSHDQPDNLFDSFAGRYKVEKEDQQRQAAGKDYQLPRRPYLVGTVRSQGDWNRAHERIPRDRGEEEQRYNQDDLYLGHT